MNCLVKLVNPISQLPKKILFFFFFVVRSLEKAARERGNLPKRNFPFRLQKKVQTTIAKEGRKLGRM